MKKLITIILLLYISALSMTACSKDSATAETNKWDCTVICAEQPDAENYVVTYSDKIIISETGILSFQNRNDFDITIHLLADGKEERTQEIKAGGSSVLYQIDKGVEYTVGCHANVDKETEIKLMVYDGGETEVFRMSYNAQHSESDKGV